MNTLFPVAQESNCKPNGVKSNHCEFTHTHTHTQKERKEENLTKYGSRFLKTL
jgi:hypothetical protein